MRLQLSPIKCRCLFRMLGPVRRPVTTLDCVLLNDRNLVLKSWTRAQNLLLSLSVITDKIPPDYHMLVIYPGLDLFPYILLRNPPRPALVRPSGEQFCLLQACRQFYFLIPQNVQVPKTTPQNAGWKCLSLPFGTYTNGKVVLMA